MIDYKATITSFAYKDDDFNKSKLRKALWYMFQNLVEIAKNVYSTTGKKPILYTTIEEILESKKEDKKRCVFLSKDARGYVGNIKYPLREEMETPEAYLERVMDIVKDYLHYTDVNTIEFLASGQLLQVLTSFTSTGKPLYDTVNAMNIADFITVEKVLAAIMIMATKSIDAMNPELREMLRVPYPRLKTMVEETEKGEGMDVQLLLEPIKKSELEAKMSFIKEELLEKITHIEESSVTEGNGEVLLTTNAIMFCGLYDITTIGEIVYPEENLANLLEGKPTTSVYQNIEGERALKGLEYLVKNAADETILQTIVFPLVGINPYKLLKLYATRVLKVDLDMMGISISMMGRLFGEEKEELSIEDVKKIEEKHPNVFTVPYLRTMDVLDYAHHLVGNPGIEDIRKYLEGVITEKKLKSIKKEHIMEFEAPLQVEGKAIKDLRELYLFVKEYYPSMPWSSSEDMRLPIIKAEGGKKGYLYDIPITKEDISIAKRYQDSGEFTLAPSMDPMNGILKMLFMGSPDNKDPRPDYATAAKYLQLLIKYFPGKYESVFQYVNKDHPLYKDSSNPEALLKYMETYMDARFNILEKIRELVKVSAIILNEVHAADESTSWEDVVDKVEKLLPDTETKKPVMDRLRKGNSMQGSKLVESLLKEAYTIQDLIKPEPLREEGKRVIDILGITTEEGFMRLLHDVSKVYGEAKEENKLKAASILLLMEFYPNDEHVKQLNTLMELIEVTPAEDIFKITRGYLQMLSTHIHPAMYDEVIMKIVRLDQLWKQRRPVEENISKNVSNWFISAVMNVHQQVKQAYLIYKEKGKESIKEVYDKMHLMSLPYNVFEEIVLDYPNYVDYLVYSEPDILAMKPEETIDTLVAADKIPDVKEWREELVKLLVKRCMFMDRTKAIISLTDVAGTLNIFDPARKSEVLQLPLISNIIGKT